MPSKEVHHKKQEGQPPSGSQSVGNNISSYLNESWTRVEDYCFLTALRTAVSALPRNDFALTCLTSSSCPQPWRCLGNSVFVSCACLVRALLMGPYLAIDTLFVKPKLYRLYQRYLSEGQHVRGTILFRRPGANGVNITLVEYTLEDGRRFVKYLAHHGKVVEEYDTDDEHDCDCSQEGEIIDLLVLLPKYPQSACSAWTAQLYVDQHSTTCQKCFLMILWSIWLTLGVALVIALVLQHEMNEDCRVTLAVLIPAALALVSVYLYLRDDPVQKFLLHSGKEVMDEEWGRNHIDEARVGQTVEEGAKCIITPSSSYLCGSPPQSQDMDDRGDDDDDDVSI